MSETLFDTFHSRYDRALSMVGAVTVDERGKLGRQGYRHHEEVGKNGRPTTRDLYYTTPKSQLRKPGVERIGMRMMIQIMHGIDSVVTAQGVRVYQYGRLQAGLEMRRVHEPVIKDEDQGSSVGNQDDPGAPKEPVRWIRAFRAIDPAEIVAVKEGEEPVLFEETGNRASLTIAKLEEIDPAAAAVVAAVSADMDRLLLESFNAIGS